MHCNDAAPAIQHLDDMASPPSNFLLRDSFLRATPHAPHLFALQRDRRRLYDMTVTHSGCERCKNSGYAGRLAVVESHDDQRRNAQAHHFPLQLPRAEQGGHESGHETSAWPPSTGPATAFAWNKSSAHLGALIFAAGRRAASCLRGPPWIPDLLPAAVRSRAQAEDREPNLPPPYITIPPSTVKTWPVM